MTGYISDEIEDWLRRLRAGLPATAPRAGYRPLRRAALIRKIRADFAPLMSTGPEYSRSVYEQTVAAVRLFGSGHGDSAAAALARAGEARQDHLAMLRRHR